VLENTAGGRITARPRLIQTLDILRNCDTFVVWKLDRLCRSVEQLIDLVGCFECDGVNFLASPMPSTQVPPLIGFSSK